MEEGQTDASTLPSSLEFSGVTPFISHNGVFIFAEFTDNTEKIPERN